MAVRIRSRPGSVLALIGGAALLVLFFFPWLSFRGLAVEFGNASGYQLAAGEIATKVATLTGSATEKRPWFFGCAVLAGLAMFTGALGAAQVVRRKQTGSILVGLALLGGGIALLALTVKVRGAALVETTPVASYYATLAAWAVVGLAGLLEVAVSMAAGERRSRPRRPKGSS